MDTIIKYKNFYIVKMRFGFRVKLDPYDTFAVHYSFFESIAAAERFIDEK